MSPDRTVDRDAAYAVTALAVPGTVGELDAFYVDPDQWGTGVADTLMGAALAALRERRLDVGPAVAARGQPARAAVLRRHGWAPTADGRRSPSPATGRDPDDA